MNEKVMQILKATGMGAIGGFGGGLVFRVVSTYLLAAMFNAEVKFDFLVMAQFIFVVTVVGAALGAIVGILGSLGTKSTAQKEEDEEEEISDTVKKALEADKAQQAAASGQQQPAAPQAPPQQSPGDQPAS